jgi:hypothetical protein
VEGGCAGNRKGALCAVCEDGFTSDSSGGPCTPCPSKGAATGGTIGFSILIVAAVCVCYLSIVGFNRTALTRLCSVATLCAQVVLYLVWRLDGEDVPRTSPFDVVKAYTPEHRARPNYTYAQLYLFCPLHPIDSRF